MFDFTFAFSTAITAITHFTQPAIPQLEYESVNTSHGFVWTYLVIDARTEYSVCLVNRC